MLTARPAASSARLRRVTATAVTLNIWHISHEGLELEDPANAPNYEKLLKLGVTPQKAPDEATEISLDFEKGVPVALQR